MTDSRFIASQQRVTVDNTVEFFVLTGYKGNPSSSETNTADEKIQQNGTLKNGFVNVGTNTISNACPVTTRKNGTTTGNIDCNVTADTTGIFEDTTNTDSVTAGDTWYWRIAPPDEVGTNSITTHILAITFTPQTSTNTVSMFVHGINAIGQTESSTTLYKLLTARPSVTVNTVETTQKFRVRADFIWKTLTLVIFANARAVTDTLKSRIDTGSGSANGNQTISTTASTTGIFQDTTNTDSVTAGNDIDYSMIFGASASSITISQYYSEGVSTGNKSINYTGNQADVSTAGTVAYFPLQGDLTATTTENNRKSSLRYRTQWKELNLYVVTNTRDSGTHTLKSRIDTSAGSTMGTSADGNQLISFTTETGLLSDTTNIDNVNSTDKINYKYQNGGSTGNVTISWVGSIQNTFDTKTKTFTIDAILKQTLTKTFTLDAILVNRYSKPLTIDAILKATLSKSFTIDAILKATQSKNFALDSILVNRLSKTFTIDAILKSTTPKNFSLDAVLVNQRTKSFTIDSILKQSGLTKTFTIDANLLQTQIKEFSIDAILKATIQKTFSLDSILKQSGLTKTFTIDAYLVYTKQFTIDAILIKVISKDFSLDAYLLQTQSKQFSLDALLFLQPSKTYTLDAILKTTINKTFTLDAILKATFSKTFTLDAILVKVLSKSFTIDSILTKTQSKSFLIDAILKQTIQKQFTLDAILKITQTKQFLTDSILIKTQSKTFSIDAILKQVQSKTFSIDAILKLSNILKSFSLDAILTKIQSKNFTIDAILTLGGEKFFDVDAILIYVQSKTFTIDAILRLQPIKPFTINAILRYTQTKSFFLDAILVDIFNTQIYAVYSTNSGELELKSVSSSNSILGASYATNQGDIELK